jgi:hypothetical protein
MLRSENPCQRINCALQQHTCSAMSDHKHYVWTNHKLFYVCICHFQQWRASLQPWHLQPALALVRHGKHHTWYVRPAVTAME